MKESVDKALVEGIERLIDNAEDFTVFKGAEEECIKGQEVKSGGGHLPIL